MSFCFFTTNAQIGYKLKNEKPSSTKYFGEVAMLEVEYFGIMVNLLVKILQLIY